MPDTLILVLEILGTVAFAMSGASVAIRKKMDILGVVILGVTTSIGGGIIRDIMIDTVPPSGLVNPVYAFVAIGVSLVMFIPPVRHHVNINNWIIMIVDSVGLGVFTVVGCRTASSFDNLSLQIFLGVLSGVGGGVLRDIFANETPVIFVKRFYALASLAGAIVCSVIMPYSEQAGMIAGAAVIIVLRVLAAKFRWNMPKAD